MKTKDFLNQARECSKRLRDIDDEIELIEYDMSGLKAVRYDKEKVQTSNDNSRLEILYDRLQEKKKERETLKHDLIIKRQDVLDSIDSVKDTDEHALLYYRYVRCCTWNEVADKLSYSVDHVKGYLHSKALENLNTL